MYILTKILAIWALVWGGMLGWVVWDTWRERDVSPPLRTGLVVATVLSVVLGLLGVILP